MFRINSSAAMPAADAPAANAAADTAQTANARAANAAVFNAIASMERASSRNQISAKPQPAAMCLVRTNSRLKAHVAARGPGWPDMAEWRIDGYRPRSTPRTFRATDVIPPGFRGATAWLAQLRLSGSGTLTANDIQFIQAHIGPQHRLLVLDLRQESHAILGDRTATLRVRGCTSNIGSADDGILSDEEQHIEALRASPQVSTFLAQADSAASMAVPTDGQIICSEMRLAASHAVFYHRIPVTDGMRPSDAQVDDFVALVKALPPDAWLHVHCMAGKGRTTTFMAMFDMLRNAHFLPLMQILARQRALAGGYDICAGDTVAKKDRRRFIAAFYDYARDQANGYPKPWSFWLQTGYRPESSGSETSSDAASSGTEGD